MATEKFCITNAWGESIMNIKKLSALILSGAFMLSFAGYGNSEPAATVPKKKHDILNLF